MRLIDAEYTRAPFYGYRKLTVRLQQQGYAVNPKRVLRLMRTMGLQAVYPRPRTSIPDAQHKKYPYLLRDVKVTRPNQVWSTDITYVPMPQGFMYLVAVIDWFSRFVLTWRLSNTLDSRFCLDALRLALQVGSAGHLQYRSRRAVHRARLHRRVGNRPRSYQHGWSRARLRQHLR